jgi:hypothetical protein
MIADALLGVQLLRGLPALLRHPVTGPKARATVRARLERREADFLSLVRWAVRQPAEPDATRDEDLAADVFTVPVGGGDPCQLTRTEGPASWPAVSPDGLTVAYVGHAHPRDVSRHQRLYTVPVTGGSPVCLPTSTATVSR